MTASRKAPLGFWRTHVTPPSLEIVTPPEEKPTAIMADPSALIAAFIQSPCEPPALAPLGPLDAIHVAPASVEV